MSDLQQLAAQIEQSARGSDNTLRSCSGRWRAYSDFCDAHGYQSMPATQEAISHFLAHLMDLGRSQSTISGYLWAIGKVHQSEGYELSQRLLDLGKGAKRLISRESKKAPPISFSHLQDVIDHMGDGLACKRDKALFLVHFLSGRRGNEILSLHYGQIKFIDDGVRILISRAKTDQEGKGDYVVLPCHADKAYCVKTALSDWYKASHVQAGSVFRGMQGNARYVRDRAMSLKSYNQLIKGYFGSDYSSHSFRSGHVTSAIDQGVSPALIMRQTGHRSEAVMMGYDRQTQRVLPTNSASQIMEACSQ